MATERKQTGYGVIGLGRFGATLAKALAESGEDVTVLDASEEKIRAAREYTDAAFVTDRLDRETLMECGIQNCDTVIVAVGEVIDTSILTTLLVGQLGVRRLLAKAISQDQGAVLEKLGAEVIYPERDMALRLAKRLTNHRLLDSLALKGDVEISEISVCGPLIGQTVEQADLRRKYGLNIIAVESGGRVTIDIRPDSVFREGDAIVVIGKKDAISRFDKNLPEA